MTDFAQLLQTPVQIEALNAAIESWGAMGLDDIEPYPDNLRAYPPYGMSLEEFMGKLPYDANLIPGGDFSALLLAREIYENGICGGRLDFGAELRRGLRHGGVLLRKEG